MFNNIRTVIKKVKQAGNVIINGKGVHISAGDSITICGNQVTVGETTVNCNGPRISISIEGDVGSIDGVGDVTVTGNVGGSVDTSAGNVNVGGDVGGGIECACGSITVKGNVSGDIDCSCGNVKVGSK